MMLSMAGSLERLDLPFVASSLLGPDDSGTVVTRADERERLGPLARARSFIGRPVRAIGSLRRARVSEASCAQNDDAVATAQAVTRPSGAPQTVLWPQFGRLPLAPAQRELLQAALRKRCDDVLRRHSLANPI
jgi:hypothetical protein